MRDVDAGFVGVLIILFYLVFIIVSLICIVEGVLLALSASVLLFVILLFVPVPIITIGGALSLFLNINIFAEIMRLAQ